MVGGLLTERVGRRVVLPLAVALIALGLAGMATVPTWELFLALAIPFGLGSGAIDGGMNGLVLDLYPDSRGRALNLLHLFFSLGALASPLVVGRLVEAGAAWQTVILGTALAAVPIAILFAVADLPSGRHARGWRDGRRPDRALRAAHRARGRHRLLRRVRGRRLELARPLPRVGDARAGDLGAGAVLGLPCARAHRDRGAGRPVRPRPVRGHGVARRGDRARGGRARPVAAGVDRAVRRRRLRVRAGLPADHGRRRRSIPDPVGGGQRVPVGLRGHRRDRLPAADGLRVGRGRAGRGDDRGRDPRLRVRRCPVRCRRAAGAETNAGPSVASATG